MAQPAQRIKKGTIGQGRKGGHVSIGFVLKISVSLKTSSVQEHAAGLRGRGRSICMGFEFDFGYIIIYAYYV